MALNSNLLEFDFAVALNSNLLEFDLAVALDSNLLEFDLAVALDSARLSVDAGLKLPTLKPAAFIEAAISLPCCRVKVPWMMAVWTRPRGKD